MVFRGNARACLHHALVHPTCVVGPTAPLDRRRRLALTAAPSCTAPLSATGGAADVWPPSGDIEKMARTSSGASGTGDGGLPHQFERMEWLGDALLGVSLREPNLVLHA